MPKQTRVAVSPPAERDQRSDAHLRRTELNRTVADLHEKPGHLIRRLRQVATASFENCVEQFSITASQHLVMTALYKHPDIGQVALGDIAGYDKMTTGEIVKRLVKKGIVKRDRSPTDGRAVVLSLTPNGEDLLLEMQDAVQKSQQEILAPLSPSQKKQFFQIMRRLVGLTKPYKPTDDLEDEAD